MVVLKLAAAYGGALAARPLETKIATGALVAGLGDALAQLCDPSTETFSWPRSQCFVGFGGLYTGAWQHFCFGWLTTHCTGVGLLPGYAQRALLNQGVVVPLLYAPLFLLLAGATRGLSLRNIIATGRRRYANLVLSNWRFWVPVEMLFFALLPPELLVPATCLAALCWNMILSTLSFRSRGERPAVALIS